MWRLSAAALLLLLSGCASGDQVLRPDPTATMLHMADPRAAGQIVSGFFPLENGGRWTERTFSATLKPPLAAVRKGAVLVLRFGIPGPSIDKLHSIQVTARVNGVALAPQDYTNAGEMEYIRDAPPSAFRQGNANVDFALDKALPPGPGEHRELGVVVKMVGFEAK